MAGKNSSSTQDSENMENTESTRSEAITLGAQESSNLLAAWQGVANLFGGQANFVWTDEGIIARDFSTDGAYNPATIAKGVSGRDRRVDFSDAYPIVVLGQAPAEFKDAQEITKWVQQYFRVPGEDGKSPVYVRDAVSAYKKAHAFPGRKGRPKKVVRIENLGQLDPSLLAGIDMAELESLAATLQTVISGKATATEATA